MEFEIRCTTKDVIPRERSESRNLGTDFTANVAASAKILRLRSINPADLFHFAQDDSIVCASKLLLQTPIYHPKKASISSWVARTLPWKNPGLPPPRPLRALFMAVPSAFTSPALLTMQTL